MNQIEQSCKSNLRLAVFALLTYSSLSLLRAAPAGAFVLSVGPTSGPFGGYICADVRNGSLAPGTPVQAYDCNAEPNQQFEWNGSTIYTMGGQRCLEALVPPDVLTGGPEPPPYPVVSDICNGSPDQTWPLFFVFPGGSLSWNDFGFCLDATNMANGTQLVLNDCATNATSSQQWQLK
jgi:hypothetical protein